MLYKRAHFFKAGGELLYKYFKAKNQKYTTAHTKNSSATNEVVCTTKLRIFYG